MKEIQSTMSINNLNLGDIVLLDFPYTDNSKSKRRPALVIKEFEDSDIIVCRITTKIYNSDYDIKINKSSDNGLLTDSVIRVHKIATISKSLISQKIGKTQKNIIKSIVQQIFHLIK